MLEKYLKENYPDILAEYERSQKTFDELFQIGDLVEYLSSDIRGHIVICWTYYFVKKVYVGEDSGGGIPWGDDYYCFSDRKNGKGVWNLIDMDSEWWKTLRPVGRK